MKIEWTELKTKVLKLLKMESFTATEGKHSFTDEQKALLESIEPGYANKMIQALDAELAKGTEENENAALIAELKGQLEVAENVKKDLKTKVEILSTETEPDNKGVIIDPKKTNMKTFAPNMTMKHNLAAEDYFTGEGMRVMASDNIDVTELRSEFGKYLDKLGSGEILKTLMQNEESTAYMTEKIAITEWRAAQAVITSVVQQFTGKWTPLTNGKATFTPLKIYNRHHKINVAITPAEIVQDWIAFLYQEDMRPMDMPITKYIINELIVPKVQEDRELKLLGKGVYLEVDPSGLADGDAGQTTGGSMDGFITILKNEKASGTSKMNFLQDGNTYDEASIVEFFNAFCDSVKPLYQNMKMNLFVSRETFVMYKRAYQKLYPFTKNMDANDTAIDFTNFTLVQLPSMVGEKTIFTTPKQNFIHLTNINKAANKIFIQELNYDVKVFAEWWEAVGFAMAEAVFAYVPDEESGSGSNS